MCEKLTFDEPPLDGIGPRSAAPVAGLTRIAEGAEPASSSRRASTSRRRLWELPHKYHCPVIGTCLHVDELRRLAQKAGCTPKHDLGDFEVHVSFVAAADSKNALSLAAQRALERKYAAIVKRFARARTPTDLEHLWDEALANGQVQGALWAVMTHPHAPAEMRTRAYEEVHMLSHQIGAGLSLDLKALAETRDTLRRVRQDSAAANERSRRALAEKDASLTAAEQRLRGLQGVEAELTTARARIAALESGDELAVLRARVEQQDREIAGLRQAAREHAAMVDGLQHRVDTTEQHRAEVVEELADREASLRALEDLLAPRAHAPICGCDGDSEHCALEDADRADGIDLGGKRILCVGGRGSLNAHYRTLVERCNGELLRHDGGLEDSRARLEALLASADAVVCPVDSVSHDACLRTKRFCKQHSKPCVLMQRSGVGAFARALSQLTAPAQLKDATAAYPWLLRA